jgi:hypothetical protein
VNIWVYIKWSRKLKLQEFLIKKSEWRNITWRPNKDSMEAIYRIPVFKCQRSHSASKAFEKDKKASEIILEHRRRPTRHQKKSEISQLFFPGLLFMSNYESLNSFTRWGKSKNSKLKSKNNKNELSSSDFKNFLREMKQSVNNKTYLNKKLTASQHSNSRQTLKNDTKPLFNIPGVTKPPLKKDFSIKEDHLPNRKDVLLSLQKFISVQKSSKPTVVDSTFE